MNTKKIITREGLIILGIAVITYISLFFVTATKIFSCPIGKGVSRKYY